MRLFDDEPASRKNTRCGAVKVPPAGGIESVKRGSPVWNTTLPHSTMLKLPGVTPNSVVPKPHVCGVPTFATVIATGVVTSPPGADVGNATPSSWKVVNVTLTSAPVVTIDIVPVAPSA
jgi:hypothetical protein